MALTAFSYVLAATLLLGSAISSICQVQRTLVTDTGETHDTPQSHPLTWWTRNPLRLDAGGALMVGKDADNGHTITAQDYHVQQKVTTLGTLSNHHIVQVLTTIHAGPRVILAGSPAADFPASQWKSLLVETHTGYYEEVYALQIDMGAAQVGSAGIYGSGPNAILATYDPAGGNGGGCFDGNWWFDHAGAHPVDFTELKRAIAQVAPKDGLYNPRCWDLHSSEGNLELWVQSRTATCHSCGGLGTVHANYRIQHGAATPVSVHFKPGSEDAK